MSIEISVRFFQSQMIPLVQEPRVRRVDRAFDRLQVVGALADLHDRVLVARQLHPIVRRERRLVLGPARDRSTPSRRLRAPDSCAVRMRSRNPCASAARSACRRSARRRRTSSRGRCSAVRPLRCVPSASEASRCGQRSSITPSARGVAKGDQPFAEDLRAHRRAVGFGDFRRRGTPAPNSGASSAPIGASPGDAGQKFVFGIGEHRGALRRLGNGPCRWR